MDTYSKLEQRYKPTRRDGILRILNSFSLLRSERENDIDISLFLADFERAVKEAGLSKTEKSIVNILMTKDLTMKEIGEELAMSKEPVVKQLHTAAAKVAKQYQTWKIKEEGIPEKKTYTFIHFHTADSDQIHEVEAIKTDEQGAEVGKFHTLVTNIEDIEENKGGVLEHLALRAVDCFIDDSVVVTLNELQMAFLERNPKYMPVEHFLSVETMSKLLEHDLEVNNVEELKAAFFNMRSELEKAEVSEKDYTNLLVEEDEKKITYKPNDKTIIRKWAVK